MIRYLISFLLILFFSTISYCQPINGRIDQLSIENGVDGLDVDNFFFDKDNKIWLKTQDCINICSPKKVTNIYFGNSTNNIHSQSNIAVINEFLNKIDIFYENELLFFDRYNKDSKEFEKITIHSRAKNTNQRYIQTIKYNKTIYHISQVNSTLIIHNIYNNKTKEINLLNDFEIVKIIIKKNSYYLLDKKDNVYSVDINNVLTKIKINSPLREFTVNSKTIKQKETIFHLDSKQRLWLSIKQKSGVYIKEKDSDYFHLFESLPQDKLFVWVSEDNTGKLLFGSTNTYLFTDEYYVLDEKSVVNKWDYLASIFVFPKKIISKDFYKEMYVSTYRSLIILSFINNDFFISSSVSKGEINNIGAYGNVIWGICQIDKERILYASESKVLSIYNNSNSKYETYSKTDSFSLFYSRFSPKDSLVYSVGKKSFFGKSFFTKTNFNKNKTRSIHTPFQFIFMEKNRDNNFFVVTESDSELYNLYLFDPHTQDFKKLQSIPYKPYFMQYDSELNYLWCVDSKQGVFYIDLNSNSKNINLISFEKSINTNFYCINIGIKNKIFISTNKGLYVWDKKLNKIIKHLSSINGLSSNRLCTAQEDNLGNIWISTLHGLNYYNWKSQIVFSYYLKDGIPNNEFNTHSSFKDSNNNLFFGNSNGLLKIDIDKFYQKEFQIYFDRFGNNDPYFNLNANKAIKIHYNESNNVKVVVGSKDWRNKESIKFYSYLTPYDDKWSRPSYNNHFSYKHLPKGKYILQIKAVSGEGTVSNKLNISFEIYKKWFETNWFYNLLTTLLVSSILLGINYYFLFQKRKKERSKLIFEKRISELELGVLQAQMNPHFVFNSISAIQDKIHTGKKELVSQYLNDFASLMRLYLESSRKKVLTLKNEIRLLTLYLNLEQMRFGEKLKFSINIAQEIDTVYTEIPSMILQPFVENAINHGIFHKTTTGHINISFSEDQNENLTVQITDDGVGRAKAMEIKTKSYNPNKSRALQIINERIEVLKELHDFVIDITIEDLYDNNEASGTSVNIKFLK